MTLRWQVPKSATPGSRGGLDVVSDKGLRGVILRAHATILNENGFYLKLIQKNSKYWK
jgi:hypothetical protein